MAQHNLKWQHSFPGDLTDYHLDRIIKDALVYLRRLAGPGAKNIDVQVRKRWRTVKAFPAGIMDVLVTFSYDGKISAEVAPHKMVADQRLAVKRGWLN